LGKCRRREDGQQAHDGQKLLHVNSPVVFLDFEFIRRVEELISATQVK